MDVLANWPASDYGNKTRFTSNEALGETGPKIRFYWESTLNWTIKVKDKDGNWVNSLGGTTTWDTVHRSLCVANAQPILPPFNNPGISANEAFEKVIQYSCDWAAGEGGTTAAQKKAIIDKAWAGIDQTDTSSTGARHDIYYTFISPPSGFTVKAFLENSCQGSCGHHARFFSHIGASQGLSVDVVSMALQPAGNGDAYHIAPGVADVDGDWSEYTGGPSVSGNSLWWFNRPLGTANPLQHTATQYNDGTNNTVYDPSFGLNQQATWQKYMGDSVTHYWIRATATPTGTWKTKAAVVTAGEQVLWKELVNYGTFSGLITWPAFP